MKKSHSFQNHTMLNYVSTGYNIINHTNQIETAKIADKKMFLSVLIFHNCRKCTKYTKRVHLLNIFTKRECTLRIITKTTRKELTITNSTKRLDFVPAFVRFRKHMARANIFGSLSDSFFYNLLSFRVIFLI